MRMGGRLEASGDQDGRSVWSTKPWRSGSSFSFCFAASSCEMTMRSVYTRLRARVRRTHRKMLLPSLVRCAHRRPVLLDHSDHAVDREAKQSRYGHPAHDIPVSPCLHGERSPRKRKSRRRGEASERAAKAGTARAPLCDVCDACRCPRSHLCRQAVKRSGETSLSLLVLLANLALLAPCNSDWFCTDVCTTTHLDWQASRVLASSGVETTSPCSHLPTSSIPPRSRPTGRAGTTCCSFSTR